MCVHMRVCVPFCALMLHVDMSVRSYSLMNEITSCQPSVHFYNAFASAGDDVTMCLKQIIREIESVL